MMMKRLAGIILISGLLGACASTDYNKNGYQSNNNSGQVADNYRDLGEYLRGISGVQVSKTGSGYSILVRGTVSNAGSTEPLFVVDKTPVGGYDQAAAVVDPNNIRRVEVLKDVASTTAYGMRGANGVIIIHMNK
jgi:TonB-dependent SusC/RagA subfamily outer membrane receptor